MKTRAFWLCFAASLGALALGLGFGVWKIHQVLHTPFPETDRKTRFVVIPEGESGSRIARRLQEADVIPSEFWFKILLRMRGPSYRLKAGEYRFDVPLSMDEVAEKLNRGLVYHHKVTVPEGKDRRDIANIWSAAGFGARDDFLRLFQSPSLIADLDPEAGNLEGYLFPETYLVPRQHSPQEITRLMVNNLRVHWTEQRQNQARELGMSLREILTLASLVEMEASLPQERHLVSAVFHNRLRRNMKLECDPTVIYAVKEIKPFDGIIHRSDLELDSPYNTYLYPGLPPGPICNPGLASIEAALNPAPADYLFFVSRNDGSHIFSETYRDHHRAVMEYQRR